MDCYEINDEIVSSCFKFRKPLIQSTSRVLSSASSETESNLSLGKREIQMKKLDTLRKKVKTI